MRVKIHRCRRGHRMTQANRASTSSHGRKAWRCRACKTAYMRRYMRRRRRGGRR